MIDIVIADNQALTREGIISVLTPLKDIHLLGYASTPAVLDQMIREHEPKVVIIDYDFDHNFGPDEVKEINARFNFTNVLVVSNSQNRGNIMQIIDSGVKNHVSKYCPADEFIEAVYATANGVEYFCDSTSKILFGDKQLMHAVENAASLSSRETEIIHLIAKGLTNKDIADKLYLSVHTIKTHRKNIIKKLGFTFKNAAELVMLIGYMNDFFI
ncbi:MAG: response regulator transcription factor [Mucilaginibacter sp.]|uniref:response regulator transcription factor n=1 Tax=Mucilaginibacter sp. TaxID=1882438 RepID=UPI0031A74245